jgi:hypothetical protein
MNTVITLLKGGNHLKVPKETTPQFSNIAIISAPWLLPLQTQ